MVLIKVLFIGGTGNISAYVSKLAVEKGMEVYILTRGNSSSLFAPKGAKYIIGNIKDAQDVAQKIKEMEFDVVADFITYMPEHLKSNLDLFRNKCKQYIFVSSTSVYNPQGRDIREDDALLSNLAWDYPRNKIACEQLLEIDHILYGTNYTIVRPGETNGDLRISGVFVPHPHYWSIIDRMMKGNKVVVNDDGSAVRQYTHSSDFAKGFIGLFLNPKAYGEAFNITSDEVLSWREVTEMVAEAAGVKAEIAYIPSLDIIRLMPRITYGGGDHGSDTYGTLLCSKAHSKTVDNSKIKALVPEFICKISFYETIRHTINFYNNHPEFKQVDKIWNQQMDNLIQSFF